MNKILSIDKYVLKNIYVSICMPDKELILRRNINYNNNITMFHFKEWFRQPVFVYF